MPVSERYRVINPDSSYYGHEGAALDKAAVEAEVGADLGRRNGWYAHWDVLLDFVPAGVGFKADELERIDNAG